MHYPELYKKDEKQSSARNAHICSRDQLSLFHEPPRAFKEWFPKLFLLQVSRPMKRRSAKTQILCEQWAVASPNSQIWHHPWILFSIFKVITSRCLMDTFWHLNNVLVFVCTWLAAMKCKLHESLFISQVCHDFVPQLLFSWRLW